jgi:hypothetical protein
MRKLIWVCLLTIPTMASVAPRAWAVSGTTPLNATIKGVFDSGSTGNCPVGYGKQCASGTCLFFQPATGTIPSVSGTFAGTVSNMCVTVDEGNNVTAGTGAGSCFPFFGNIDVQIKKSGNKVALDIAGAYCLHQKGSSSHMIEGGFGVIGADSTDTAATGWGTATGTAEKKSSSFSLKLSGSFTP